MQGEEEGRGREERKQKGRAHGRGANWEEGRGRIGRGGRGGRESRAAANAGFTPPSSTMAG